MAAKLRTAVSPTDVVYPVDFEKFEKEQVILWKIEKCGK